MEAAHDLIRFKLGEQEPLYSRTKVEALIKKVLSRTNYVGYWVDKESITNINPNDYLTK